MAWYQWRESNQTPELTSYRYDTTSQIPANGVTDSISVSTDDFLPLPTNASADVETRSGSFGYTDTPTCGGSAANAMELLVLGFVDSVAHQWTMWAPYSDSVTMPELDPELADELFPSGLTQTGWILEARVYPNGGFDSARQSSTELADPQSWLAGESQYDQICGAIANGE